MADDLRVWLLLALMLGSLPLWTWLRFMPYRYIMKVFP
jgi:hypothetical protein